MLGAVEALELGLVTRVVPGGDLQAAARELATELASGPAEAIATTKRLIWDGVGAGVEERLESESKAVTKLSGTSEALDRLRAVIDR
jgi:2-(1,2-epoxy-1,2-dihydrophenyl)acetyl-CoA isomerase